MISDTTDICMVSRQYGFSCAFSEHHLQRMISDTTDICMVPLQYGFSCAFSEHHLQRMISDTTDMCMVSLQYGFSCAFSEHHLQRMISDSADICAVSLQYGFSCAFSEHHLQRMISDTTDICMVYLQKDRARLDKLYTRIKRMDYLPDNAPTFPSLVGKADERLFRSIELNPSHVLRDLLPPKAKRPYKLRPRAHDYVLPIKDDKNFVPRYLYPLSMNP